MIIKICGLREPDNIRAVTKLGVDMIGFDFRLNSERFVQMISSMAGIIPDYSLERLNVARGKTTAATDADQLPKRVGVFSDDMPQSIVTRIYNYSLDYVQLDGGEPRETCENLLRTVIPDIKEELKIVKTIKIEDANDFEKCEQYVGAVDMFLFNVNKSKADWSILNSYTEEIPFLLGDIELEDAEKLKSLKHKMFAGVNLNEHFETAPVIKDVEKISQFISIIKGELSK